MSQPKTHSWVFKSGVLPPCSLLSKRSCVNYLPVRSVKRDGWRTPGEVCKEVKHDGEGSLQQIEKRACSPGLMSTVLSAVACFTASAYQARADELGEAVTTVKAGDTDWIISIAFSIAVVALGAVTLGVSFWSGTYSLLKSSPNLTPCLDKLARLIYLSRRLMQLTSHTMPKGFLRHTYVMSQETMATYDSAEFKSIIF